MPEHGFLAGRALCLMVLLGLLACAGGIATGAWVRGLSQSVWPWTLFLSGLMLVVTGCLVCLRGLRIRGASQVHRMCQVLESEYDLVQTALLGNRSRGVEAAGLKAVPHAVFRSRSNRRQLHVVLVLVHPYGGRMHDKDLYRLTLHMGLILRQRHAGQVTGAVRYTDKLVKVQYRDWLFTALERLVPEYHAAVARWYPANRSSLRERSTRRKVVPRFLFPATDWPSSHTV
ncbi:MAG: hypothetical protein PVI37_02475 [Gammaproteobacteria bacterium]|jgi:hypothetical protein